MPHFIPGLELCRLFFEEAVQPILQSAFPNLRYSAALVGFGSEVLGFDTEMSTDHGWGPRLLLFMSDTDLDARGEAIKHTLGMMLPTEFRGYPTDYIYNERNTLRQNAVKSRPIHHHIWITSFRGFLEGYLGYQPQSEIEPADWLTFPQQKLRSIVEGAVYHDEIGLQAFRDTFRYYPRDVWLYLLAAGWTRIGQEEHLMGRAGIVGDELGSALIAARLVRDIMSLGFLMERQYAPYPKWFGTAFSRLKCGPSLGPILQAVLRAETWQQREKHLVPAYEYVAEMHNALNITGPLSAKCAPFFGRPFRVIHVHAGIAAALINEITDQRVLAITQQPLIGGIDQYTDNTDLREAVSLRAKLRALYPPESR